MNNNNISSSEEAEAHRNVISIIIMNNNAINNMSENFSSSAKQPLMLCSGKVDELYSLYRKSPYQKSPWRLDVVFLNFNNKKKNVVLGGEMMNGTALHLWQGKARNEYGTMGTRTQHAKGRRGIQK